jgi:hypothetical protein
MPTSVVSSVCDFGASLSMSSRSPNDAASTTLFVGVFFATAIGFAAPIVVCGIAILLVVDGAAAVLADVVAVDVGFAGVDGLAADADDDDDDDDDDEAIAGDDFKSVNNP